MTEEPWTKHTPGDPMPCKCGDSVVHVRLHNGEYRIDYAQYLNWRDKCLPLEKAVDIWCFIERKGKDAIVADPYPTFEWDEDDSAIVKLEKPGQPWWVRDDDKVRFSLQWHFHRPAFWGPTWQTAIAFQIKRRPVLTPAEPQLLELLSEATDDEADAIRSAARRANIEVPE